MYKFLLLVSIFTLLMEVCAETTANQTDVNNSNNSTNVQRPLHFVVARKGDKPLTDAHKIDDPEAWFVQRRKRLLAIQRKLFAARRNIGSKHYLNNTSAVGFKSKRLDYLRKPSAAFLLANKLNDKPQKFEKLSPDHQVYFVSLPVIVPPSSGDPFEFHGPPQTCVKNRIGFQCCNKTLEEVILNTYENIRNDQHFSHYNMHKISQEVQKAASNRFRCRFEVPFVQIAQTVASASDFVSKINFNGDLNCKVQVDGKIILAYATPDWNAKDDIELIDASGLLSAGKFQSFIDYGPVSVERTTIGADKLAQIRRRLADSTLVTSSNGKNLQIAAEQKPIFLVYGPIR
ncbi:Ground-like domain-containing protein [Aphelenchoides bicaudatus]|nr:Ground-like domain-containing protein [Aphelenchoides bicaudatus]